jgi:hypothetical protein
LPLAYSKKSSQALASVFIFETLNPLFCAKVIVQNENKTVKATVKRKIFIVKFAPKKYVEILLLNTQLRN